MSSNFSHLHVHSHYSLLAALPQIKALVKAAKADGQPALAITDNGALYGAIEFYQACEKEGIKPIIGMDAYVAIRTRHDKESRIDNRRSRLILLVKNETGWKNIMKLTTRAHMEGFYYKPRIDRELISEYKEGLVCIMPFFSGEASHALKNEDDDRASESLDWYKEQFGEDFYYEVTHHPEIKGALDLKKKIIALAAKKNVPLVAAHDVYYMKPDDRVARKTLASIQSNFGSGDTPETDATEDFSFVTSAFMEKSFKDLPEALNNVEAIVEKCNLTLTMAQWKFPRFPIASGKSADDEMKEKAYAGVAWRGLSLDDPELRKRLDYEIDVIKMKGYAVYFLVVGDLLREARERGILTTIRGSVAGSLTTYVLGITNVNPLEYKLPFERFLNPERPSAPDIDMDYADNRRDEMIDYVRTKYGHDKVAQIGTFGTMMARGSVRDVARALGFPPDMGDRISKLIPMGAQGFPMTIDRALEEVPELKQLYDNDEDVASIIDMAKKIEGCARQIGVHAAGVLISPDPIVEYVPLQNDPKSTGVEGGKIITQFDMHGAGEDGVGLLKFDFLGIRNLAILADAVRLVKKIRNVVVDIENIPLDDPKTFGMLSRGETVGLFQLNGTGMTKWLMQLKPSTIHDINAMVALYRPGPMEMIPEYIKRKHDPSQIKYLDPRMEEILDRSYGVITYQDDVMMTAINLAGYSWLDADKLRKAMGKKIPELMETEKKKLMKGLLENGLSQEKSDELWRQIEPFAAYGFNKCVTGDTLVIDAGSGMRVSVESLYTQNKASTVSLDANYTFVSKNISSVQQNGVKPVFEVLTRTGKKIRATANHPLLTIDGWKNVDSLAVGEHVATPRTLEKHAGSVQPPAYMPAVLGYLLSEGNLCHPHGVYFYSTQQSEVDDFCTYASSFENCKITVDQNRKTQSVYCGQQEASKKPGKNHVRSWLESLDLLGKNALEKHIPEIVFSWNIQSLSLLLGKMWQGDGCISKVNQQAYYATSSNKLAHDTQHLLLRLGIRSTIHTKKFKYRGDFKIGYTIVVTGYDNLALLEARIGEHLLGAKQIDLHMLVSSTKALLNAAGAFPQRGTSDIVPAPILKKVRAALTQSGMTVSECAKAAGVSERLFGVDARKKGFTRGVLAAIARALKDAELLSLATSEIAWDEIVSITSCGKEMTYDLTVPGTHNFIANDIVVHNSHAASYGRVAYQTAYMKANFPSIYMAAVLTAESGDVEKIAEIVAECKRMGIKVLPPDINESYEGFTVVESEGRDDIRFGLRTIKNFGEGIAHTIIEERTAKGPFTSLEDFLHRISDRAFNKKSLESLIKAGALDAFGKRSQLLGNIDLLLEYNKETAKKPTNQTSLFGSSDDAPPPVRLQPMPPLAQRTALAWEKELLGLYVSGHPLDAYRSIFEKSESNIARIREFAKDGSTAQFAGIIEEIRIIRTKKNDEMAFVKVADFTRSIECVAFPKLFATAKELLVADKCVFIKGTMSIRNGDPSILIDAIKSI